MLDWKGTMGSVVVGLGIGTLFIMAGKAWSRRFPARDPYDENPEMRKRRDKISAGLMDINRQNSIRPDSLKQ